MSRIYIFVSRGLEVVCCISAGSKIFGKFPFIVVYYFFLHRLAIIDSIIVLLSQELSEANAQRQAENKYQHCLSRGGYRKLQWRMMAAELEKMKEAAKLDPSVVVQAPAPPPRHKKWKEARIKGGKYINPVVAKVAVRIVSS